MGIIKFVAGWSEVWVLRRCHCGWHPRRGQAWRGLTLGLAGPDTNSGWLVRTDLSSASLVLGQSGLKQSSS